MSFERDILQSEVSAWVSETFGQDQASSIPVRALRFMEEAIELFQACGMPESKVHELATFIYAKPPGDFTQELGGTGTTLLALAAAAQVSASKAEWEEFQRVLSIDPAHFRARNQSKLDAGF